MFCLFPFVPLVSLACLVSPPFLLPISMRKPSCTHCGYPALPLDSVNRGNSTCIGRKIYDKSKFAVIVFKPPITRGGITEFSGSGCAFLLKFCPVFHMLMLVFNIQKSLWQRSLQLNYLECEEEPPFCLSWTCHLPSVSMWFYQGVPVEDMGNNCFLYVPQCHRKSLAPLSCLFSRLKNSILFSCSLYRRYSITSCSFSGLTIFYLGSENRTEEFIQYSMQL